MEIITSVYLPDVDISNLELKISSIDGEHVHVRMCNFKHELQSPIKVKWKDLVKAAEIARDAYHSLG